MTNYALAAQLLYGGPSVEQAPAPAPASTPAPASITDLLYDRPAPEVAPPPPTPKEPEPAQQPTAAAPVTSEQILYGEEALPSIEVPADIAEARAADGLRKLYSPQGTYATVLPDNHWEGEEGAEAVPEPLQRAAIAELREMAADVGMSADDVRTLDSISRSVTEMPTEDARIEWREQAITRLNAEFGEGAAQALRDARALIAQDPRRARFLDTNAIGDHPDVVLQVARLARQARAQGRLK